MKYKTIVYFSLMPLAFSFALAKTCDDLQVNSPIAGLEKFSAKVAVIAHTVSDDDNTKYQAATTYLMSIMTTTDFNESDAKGFINTITPICENTILETKFRSKVCTTLAKLHGKLADKLQMSGIDNGKSFFRYIKKSLTLDQDNSNAAIFHAKGVVGVYDQGPFKRKIAAKLLEIDLDDETLSAKVNLERLDLTKDPVYKRVVEIFND
jgi:hypothetical protein